MANINGMAHIQLTVSDMERSVPFYATLLHALGMQTIVDVTGSLSISADDKAGIYANVKLVSSSITTNDGGVAILGETINDFVYADYSSEEGEREIYFGERVRVSDDYFTSDYTSFGEEDLSAGDRSSNPVWHGCMGACTRLGNSC